MRSLLPKHHFFLSSCCYSSSRALLLRLQLCHFLSSSSSLSPSPHNYYSRRLEEESRNVKVSVWWDFENCNVPTGVNVSRIAPAITEAVRANGIKGPVHITAFGDVLQLPRCKQEILAYTDVHLKHVPNVGKNSADRSLLVDLMYWASRNPPPAHLFLISGDKDFARILHHLRMHNYNILLAIQGRAPDVLTSAATIMWQWTSLLKGEDLTGKHFNHPPDGPFGSWYGHYKVPLQNPFSTNGQSASLQNVEICEPTPEPSSGTIPKSIRRQIKHTLSFHPKGISISALRAELDKNDVRLDKSLYGYQKLSSFLFSIPGIQLKPLRDGNFCVRLAPSASPEPPKSNDGQSRKSAVKNEERGRATDAKLNGEGKTMARDADGTPSMVSLHESSSEKAGDVVDALLSKTQLPLEDNEVSKSKVDFVKTSSKMSSDNEIIRPEDVSSIISGNASENHSAGNDYTMVESGRIGGSNESGKFIAEDKCEKPTRKDADEVSGKIASDNHSAGNDYTMVESGRIESNEPGKFIAGDKCEKPTRKGADEVCDSSYSAADKRPGGSVETCSKSSTFFGRIRSWWPFWKSSAKSDDLTTHQSREVSHSEEPKLSQLDETFSHSKETKSSEPKQTVSHAVGPTLSEPNQTVSCKEEPKLSDEEPKLSKLDQTVCHSEKHELFSRGSFWSDIESFVFTPKGSLLISLSTSREDLVHNLQEGGPEVLISLTEKDIFQLVDLVIADKKWLEESPSQSYPFRLTKPVQKSSQVGVSHGANGLRSIFLSRTSQPSLQKSFERDVEEHNQNIPHTEVSTPATETKYDERSRNDILADCQKLVNEKLGEHPEGINIGCIRKLFFERYDYHLDLQKLGHKRMAYLLQTIPGVKLESGYVVPSAPAVCDSDQETPILKAQVTNASDAVSNSDSELSDSAPKDDNNDSPWEELGPVSVNNSDKSDLESQLSQKAKELDTSRYPEYEPAGSYYDSSDSDGDSFCSRQRKPKFDEQESSLWQILDLYDSSKGGESVVKKSDSGDVVLGNSLSDILSSSAELNKVTLSKLPSRKYREKQRSQNNYSFVADPLLPEKEKLMDGILDGFKKADESKMQN